MSMTGENYDEMEDGQYEGWDQYGRRRAEGRSRAGAAFGAAAEAIGAPLAQITTRPFRWAFGGDSAPAATTATDYTWTDPYQAALDYYAKQDTAPDYMGRAKEQYDRYLGVVEPSRTGYGQSVQESWDRALGAMGGEQAAINALAAMAEQENLAAGAEAQRGVNTAIARRAGMAPTSQTGMGGAVPVAGADLGANAAISAATSGAQQRGNLAAQAAGLGVLGQALSTMPASWQSAMRRDAAIQDRARWAELEQQASDRMYSAEEEARKRREAIELSRLQTQGMSNLWRIEYDKLSKDKKKDLAKLGIGSVDEYVNYQLQLQQANSGALNTMASGG
jgi:hypothetical protein